MINMRKVLRFVFEHVISGMYLLKQEQTKQNSCGNGMNMDLREDYSINCPGLP
jgi:hypothetical protein